MGETLSAEVMQAIEESERRHDLPPGTLTAIAKIESNFNPNAVNRRSGARGMFQFMPDTAREMKIDPFDPVAAADAAGAYLRKWHDHFGTMEHALAAYNWGPGHVARKGLSQMPSETRDYIKKFKRETGSNLMGEVREAKRESSKFDDLFAAFTQKAPAAPTKTASSGSGRFDSLFDIFK